MNEERLEDDPLPRLTLQMDFDEVQSFVYQVGANRLHTPSFLPVDDDYYVRLDVHLVEGGSVQAMPGAMGEPPASASPA